MEIFTDFPSGASGVPLAKLKGAVHTVLTIEQRGEKVFGTTVEIYDKRDKLIETMGSNAGFEIHSGKLIRLGGKTIYFYDNDGKLFNEMNYSPEGRLTGYENYFYDEKNRLKETLIYDSKGEETGKRTFTYFPEKREVIATWNFYYNGNKNVSPMKNLLLYNEKMQWTKRTEYLSWTSEISFEYDKDGNFVKEVQCCKYNYKHQYTYKFDKQGNWIERENTYIQKGKDGKDEISPGWMNEFRVITYYSEQEIDKEQISPKTKTK